MDDAPFMRRHRLKGDSAPTFRRFARHTQCQIMQHMRAAGFVTVDIDDHLCPALKLALVLRQYSKAISSAGASGVPLP